MIPFIAKAGAWLGKNALGMLGVGSGLAQSRMQAQTAKYNTDQTIEANKQMAEYQYSKDLEMWNRQNQYNAPSSQMERLQQAGLNPAMMYGKSASVGNTSGQMPKYQAPRIDYAYKPPVDIGNTIQQWQNLVQQNAQIDLTKEQARVAREVGNIREREAQAANRYYYNRSWKMNYDRDISQQKGNWLGSKFQADLDARQAQIRNYEARNKLLAMDLEHYLWKNYSAGTGQLIRAGWNKLTRGVGGKFAKKGLNIARKRTLQVYPDRFYQNWK